MVFSSSTAACLWLDRLLADKKFKEKYGMPGSEQGTNPKLKFHLLCSKIEEIGLM